MEGQDKEGIWGRIINTKGILKKQQRNLLLLKIPKIYTHRKTYRSFPIMRKQYPNSIPYINKYKSWY